LESVLISFLFRVDSDDSCVLLLRPLADWLAGGDNGGGGILRGKRGKGTPC
jgi:hypothetical protein